MDEDKLRKHAERKALLMKEFVPGGENATAMLEACQKVGAIAIETGDALGKEDIAKLAITMAVMSGAVRMMVAAISADQPDPKAMRQLFYDQFRATLTKGDEEEERANGSKN
jgi:hypothetical protein